MTTKRKYHGWIYRDRQPGMNAFYSIHVTREGKPPVTLTTGYGASGVAMAVAYFEQSPVTIDSGGGPAKYSGLGLGHVNLESTPLGIRVYTEDGAADPEPGDNKTMRKDGGQ